MPVFKYFEPLGSVDRTDLFVHIPFEEGVGSYAYSDTRAYWMNLLNTPTWTAGANDILWALSYDGINEYAQNAGSEGPWDIRTSSVTFSFWFYYIGATGVSAVISKGDSWDFVGGNYAWCLYANPSVFGIHLSVNGIEFSEQCLHSFGYNTWNHAAIVWNRATHLMYFYANGEYLGTGTGWLPSTTDDMNNTDPCYIALAQYFGTNKYSNMAIDDLWYFKTALSAERIRQLYNVLK
jgi:hypothetical protein